MPKRVRWVMVVGGRRVHHGAMSACRECGSDDTVSIEMTVAGNVVVFIACHRCEAHSWERDGRSVELDEVIRPGKGE